MNATAPRLEPPRGVIHTIRWTLLAGLAVLAVVALRRADPVQADAVLLGAGVLAGLAAGRAAVAAGLPSAVGYLLAGAALGPSLTATLGAVLPVREALLPSRLLAGPSVLETAGLSVALLWIGRQVDVRAPARETRALLAMLAGHAVAATAITAGIALAARAGLLGAALFDHPDDVAGLAVAVMGTSGVLVASVLLDRRAEGPVTRATLGLAQLGEAAGFLVLTLWAAWGGEGTGALQVDAPGGLGDVAFTVALGAVIGGAVGGVARQAPELPPVWGTLAVLLAAFAGYEVGLSAGLLALSAGAAWSAVSPRDGRDLSDGVAAIAFGVVLTLAGARLPLHLVLPALPLGAAIAVLQGGALAAAVLGMARLAGAPPAVVQRAWTGVVAGAVPTAGLITWTGAVPRAPDELSLTATLWAASAVSGVLGMLLVHHAVDAAGEAHDTRARAAAPPPTDPDDLPEGPLRREAAALQADLDGIVRALTDGPIKSWHDDAIAWINELRRELRRHGRRDAALCAGTAAEARHAARAELVERFRSHILDRAARLGRSSWEASDLQAWLDRVARETPEVIRVDAAAPTTFRGVLRGWLTGADARQVPSRRTVAWHVSAGGPELLEPVLAVLLDAEQHLASRARELLHRGLDARGRLPIDASADAMAAVTEDLAADCRAAREEVDRIAEEASRRAGVVLRKAVRDVVHDLSRAARGELGAGERSQRAATNRRARALATLEDRLHGARGAARTRLSTLALELELQAMEFDVDAILAEHGERVARLVRGRGAAQIERVDESVDELLAEARTARATAPDAEAAARALREASATLSRRVADVLSQADELHDQLASPDLTAPLLDALLRAGARLSERYPVPVGNAPGGGWTLPPAVPTQDVAFRDIVVTFIETAVTRDLLATTQRYATKIDRLTEVVADVERVVGFHIELALAELTPATGVPLTDEERRMLEDVVVQGIDRERGQLRALRTDAEAWYADVADRFRHAVLDELRRLRLLVADGRLDEVADGLGQPEEVEASLRDRAAARIRAGIEALQRALNDDRLRQWADDLGVPRPASADVALSPALFAPARTAPELPLAYRRLFSDLALDAGDLMRGRQVLAESVRAALVERPGATLRTAAVVGPAGAGQRSVVRAALRALRARGLQRHDLSAPARAEEVARWFDRTQVGHVHVVTGFHHLLHLGPGAGDALRAFVAGIIDDEGRNAWLVEADELSWELASDLVALPRAFPRVARLDPLAPAELEAAVRARHAMSGYALEFAELEEVNDPRRVARYERAWFAAFHAATGGVARDALQLWLAAIDEIDTPGKRVVLGPVPRVPTAAMMAHVSDDTTLVLLAAARQGRLDVPTLSHLFGDAPADAAALLANLTHWGLLRRTGDTWEVPPHIARPLFARLAGRAWTTAGGR